MLYLLDKGFKLSYEDSIRAFYLACQFFAPRCCEYSTVYSIDNPKIKFGIIPEKKETEKLLCDLDERENQIKELFNKLFGNNSITVFHLTLEDDSTDGGVVGFHDLWTEMYLNVTSSEFTQLQDELEKGNLPRDLFYDREKRKEFYRPAKIWGIFSVNKFKLFSPKEWEEMSDEKKKEFIEGWKE